MITKERTKVKHTLIAPGLVLTTRRIGREKKKAPPKPTNRIAIFDRSGSMGWTLDKLIDDLYDWACKIPNGDTVSIGWFSSQGQYRFVVKGMTINGDEDLRRIKSILDSCRTTVGLTCFSEIIADLRNVVSDLSPISDRFAMVFFTDGCPVVSDTRKEIASIEKGLKDVNAEIADSIYVGYGDYYNRNLMADMAMWGGGALIHADNIARFGVEIREFTDSTIDSTPSIEVEFDNDPGRICAFTLKGKNPITMPFASGKARVSGGDEEDVIVYELTSTDPKRTSRELSEEDKSAMYASSIILSRMNRGDLALDILGKLGDLHFTRRMANAFTVSEIGTIELQLADAVSDPTKRYLEGCHYGCVPPRDAFCVLYALQLLVDDEEAKFYPGDERFRYRRIGVKSEIAEGYSEFKSDKSAACPMNTLVMNASRPNVSIQTQIPGTIDLTNECNNYGLSQKFPTFQFKNYAIVKDGALNVTVLPCSMSEDTFNKLHNEGLIDRQEQYKEDRIYAVNLGAVPVMNRSMADKNKSAVKLAEKLAETYNLEGSIKALKYFLNKIDHDKSYNKAKSEILSDSAITYLAEQGIGRNGYSPKRTMGEVEDTYIAKEFKVSGKGFSSYPPVEQVIERRGNGKSQTPSGQMVLNGVEEYEKLLVTSGVIIEEDAISSFASTRSGKKLIAELSDLIKQKNKRLRALRAQIQEAKFAVLLGNQWFDEFDSRENCKIDVEGITFSFEVKDVIEKF